MQATPTPPKPATQTVWSLGLRLLHWTLALSMILSFATSEGGKAFQAVHEWSGYVALGAASLRVLLGLLGRGYWRFAQFVRGVPATLAYARAVLNKSEPRYLGHNPLGGWMVLLLLADALCAGLSGWLLTTNRFGGMEWMEELHEALGEAFLPLLLLHLGGVLFTSWRQRENLVAAMLNGRKPAAGPGDLG